MSPDEFAGLPPAMALAIIAGHPSLAKFLDAQELPKIPRTPKYDCKRFRKGG